MKRLKYAWPVGALLLVWAVPSCADRGDGEGLKVGQEVPSFTLTTAAKELLTSEALRGQVVILCFWTTTCAACISEMPELEWIQENTRAKVVGVALDQSGWKAVRPFLERHPLSYTVALGDELLFQRFDGLSIPYTLVLDQEQRIARIYRGAVTRKTLEKDVKALGAA